MGEAIVSLFFIMFVLGMLGLSVVLGLMSDSKKKIETNKQENLNHGQP